MLSRHSDQMQRAAQAFDDLLVAAIFRKWAAIAADTVRPGRDARLLDIACGTGVLTRELAAMVDRLLRKHGKNIIDKQFATRRLADVMIDMWILVCVLSRVTASIESKGLEAAEPEIQIARVFAGQAKRRTRANFRKIDNNDDELIKALAEHAAAAMRTQSPKPL